MVLLAEFMSHNGGSFFSGVVSLIWWNGLQQAHGTRVQAVGMHAMWNLCFSSSAFVMRVWPLHLALFRVVGPLARGDFRGTRDLASLFDDSAHHYVGLQTFRFRLEGRRYLAVVVVVSDVHSTVWFGTRALCASPRLGSRMTCAW